MHDVVVSQDPLITPSLHNHKWALDLFSGTHSVGDKLRAMGYQVVSMDIKKRTKPDFPVDILTWDYWNHFQPGDFELVAASVPCNEYSQAKKVGVRDLTVADLLVKKTLEIIAYLKPEKWWIENPRNGLLKTRGILDDYPYLDLDYCQFCDWGYNKPTRFWGSENVVGKDCRLCDHQTCPNLIDGPCGRKRHRERLGGYRQKFSTRMKGRIPEKVIEYLLSNNPDPVVNLVGGESTLSNHPGSEMLLADRLLKPREKYVVGSCHTTGENTQLVMDLLVDLPNGDQQILKALIDTGAETNLVRQGVLPGHLFHSAPNPLKLVSAGGQRLEGGERLIELALEFNAEKNGTPLRDPVIFHATFFEAAIQVDAILRYPWMRSKELGVFPHKRALALETPELTLLYGHGTNRSRTYRKTKKNI